MKVWQIALSLPLVASLWAQPPQGRRGPANLENMLAQRLGLNATQQNMLHTALEEERTQIRGMMQQRQALHQSLVEAIKAGNADQIDQVTQQIASLDQQRSAIHAKAMMKFYSGLTADQKTKVGQNLEMLLGPGRLGGAALARPRRTPPPQ
jgi:Spy/CpxP family protein refolding chaperone